MLHTCCTSHDVVPALSAQTSRCALGFQLRLFVSVTRKRSQDPSLNVLNKLRLPVAKPRGGYSPLSKWHDIQMTEILGLVLWWRKVRFAHLPSPKYYILFFDFGTLKQSDLLRKSSCIKVLHPIFWSLVLWSSQIHFTHLPAPKYCILIF